MVKKLRYYARFIVVCLLLKKMKLVRELVIELERQIQEYTSTYVYDLPGMSRELTFENAYLVLAMNLKMLWSGHSCSTR